MARKFTTGIDMTGTEIQNVRAQSIAGAPGSPVAGQFWYDSTANKFTFRNNTTNIDPLARANHTGTQTASTISDFSTAATALRLDQFAIPTAAVSYNSQKITNLANGTNPADAVNFQQLQDARAGIAGVKDPVRVAAQANVNLAAPGAAIDGVTLTANDRFLAPVQSTTTQNGIYIFNGSATPATRSTDADAVGEIFDGTVVAVSEGTDAGKQYMQTAAPSGAPGAWSMVWTIYTTGGTSYTGGAGLVLSATTFNVGAGTGVVVNADDVAVDTAIVARWKTFLIGDGSTTSIAVTHSLGNQHVIAQAIEVATNATIECDVIRTSTTVTTFTFAVAPASNAIRVTIVG